MGPTKWYEKIWEKINHWFDKAMYAVNPRLEEAEKAYMDAIAEHDQVREDFRRTRERFERLERHPAAPATYQSSASTSILEPNVSPSPHVPGISADLHFSDESSAAPDLVRSLHERLRQVAEGVTGLATQDTVRALEAAAGNIDTVRGNAVDVIGNMVGLYRGEVGNIEGISNSREESDEEFRQRIRAGVADSLNWIRGRAEVPLPAFTPPQMSCPVLGPVHLISLEHKGKTAYVECVDGVIKFGGDMPFDEAAQMMFKELGKYFWQDYIRRELTAITKKVHELLDIGQPSTKIHSFTTNDEGEELVCFTEKNAVQLFMEFATWLRESKVKI